MGHVIVGTAGHIDHGKSLLVKALTGTDPDRLPEEKQRHITIDIGFAFLDDVAAIIDVPGHEKFIRNMVAGAATVDYAILVVAADDGAMPQTQEHLDILRLLGIERGLIVITKADLVEEDWLELVCEQVKGFTNNTFLENARVFIVDSLSGRGIPELRDFLIAELRGLQRKGDKGFFRLPIDRVFQMKGYGTIVTGTIISGKVNIEDRLELLPEKKEVRVRGLQTHGTSQSSLEMGQRAAINLGGVDKSFLKRGDVLVQLKHMIPSNRWRATVNLLQNIPPLKNRQRLRIHIGTQEVIARVRLLTADPHLVDFYLESYAVASRLDRFILRSYSPMLTIGGGIIVEIKPPRVIKRRRSIDLESSVRLLRASEAEFIDVYLETRAPYGANISELIQVTGYGKERNVEWIEDLLKRGKVILLGEKYLSTVSLEKHQNRITDALENFHRQKPELPGMERANLRQIALPGISDSIFPSILRILTEKGKIRLEGSLVALPTHSAILSETHEAIADRLLDLLRNAAFRPPLVTDMAKELQVSSNEVLYVLTLLLKQGRLVRLEPELFFHRDVFENGISTLREEIAVHGAVTIGNVTSLLDSTRKYIVPFLEHTDRIGVTRRNGDQRLGGIQQEQPDD